RLALPVFADDGLGQLREADGQVDVGAWKVDLPAAALDVAAEAVAERDAAEVKPAVEVVLSGDAGAGEVAEAAPQLCFDLRRQRQRGQTDGRHQSPAAPPRRPTMVTHREHVPILASPDGR